MTAPSADAALATRRWQLWTLAATCFAQFIISNQSGSRPLILWARPTPVGERV